ncbi:MAG TPA: hypothetical protein VM487_03840, partial [Phycisphaerae bacterium]|nr:hypothetical protein [Phycisphaerae bacterium]
MKPQLFKKKPGMESGIRRLARAGDQLDGSAVSLNTAWPPIGRKLLIGKGFAVGVCRRRKQTDCPAPGHGSSLTSPTKYG